MIGYVKYASPILAVLAMAAVPVVHADGPTTCTTTSHDHDSGLTDEFVLHRPRNRVIGSSIHPNQLIWGRYWDWTAWENAGVKNVHQKDLSFQILNAPPKADIKYIAIFSAGQQTGHGHANAITGQGSYWRMANNPLNDPYYFPDNAHTVIYPIDKRAPSYRFIKGKSGESFWGGPGTGYRTIGTDKWTIPGTPSNTLVFNIFDAAFEHTNSGSQKLAMVVGWDKFLSGQVNWSEIQGVIGYGMSRGGCFLTKFTDYLIRAKGLQHLKIILETLDAVCTPNEIDWPTVNVPNAFTVFGPLDYDNPTSTDDGRKCMAAYLDRLHNALVPPGGPIQTIPPPDKSNVCWKNTFGGASAVFGIGNAFCNNNTPTLSPKLTYDISSMSAGTWAVNGHTWLEQIWVNKAHCEIGRFYYNDGATKDADENWHERHIDHMNKCADKFFNNWTCGAWSTCTEYTNGKCGGYQTKTCTNLNPSIPNKTETRPCPIKSNPCVWGNEEGSDPDQCRRTQLSKNYKGFYKKCGKPPAGWTALQISNAVANSPCSIDGEILTIHKPLAYCTWTPSCSQVSGTKNTQKSCTYAPANPILASYPQTNEDGISLSANIVDPVVVATSGFYTILTPNVPASYVQQAATYESNFELQSATKPELQENINIQTNPNGEWTVGTTTAPSTNPNCLPTATNANFILAGAPVHEAALYQYCP